MTKNGNSVTLKDVYDIASSIKKDLTPILDDHEKRLREQERFQTRALAVVSIFAVFISSASSWVWNKFVSK